MIDMVRLEEAWQANDDGEDERVELVRLGRQHLAELPMQEQLASEVRALRGRDAQAAPDPAALLDVKAAARRLGLSASTVYKLAGEISISSVKAGSRLMFRPGDLAAFVEKRVRSPEKVSALLENFSRPGPSKPLPPRKGAGKAISADPLRR